MKLYHKLSALLMLSLILVGTSVLTGCDNDELDTNPYNKAGVNLLGFGPCPLKRLDIMRITGTHLNRVDKILFPQGNSMIEESTTFEEAEFRLINNEEIEVVVPDMTVPGKLRLVAGNDTIVSVSNITFEETAVVEAVTPIKNLRAGDVITISGEFVWNIASVTFNDHVVVEAENFLKNTRTEIQVAVPREAQSGDIVFSNGAENPQEVAWPEPLEIRQAVVAKLSATSLDFGGTIIISGTDLDLVETVNFPLMTKSADFTVNSEGTQLTTTVPVTTIPGIISLTQYSGLVVETASYTLPMAEYISISPTEELKKGDMVTIVGKNLDRITSVELPGGIVLQKSGFNQSATQITFIVPEDMGDGKVTLIQHENYKIESEKITMHHEGAEYPVWQGSVVIGNWSGSMDALSWDGGKELWPTVKPGQVLSVYAKMNEGADWAQLRVGNGNWAALPGTSDPYDLEQGENIVRITLTAAMIDQLVNNGGLVLCGANFTVTKVTLSVLETVIWSGSFNGSGWAGFEELSWDRYDWSTFEQGQKIVITFASTTPTLEWGCINFKTAGDGWPALSVGQVDFAGSADDQTYEFTPTAGDISRLKSENGLILQGDSYILKKVSIR
ncbi:hypothetical protein [uncultured Bacteroides sp.]|uniref:hypothetical protein n=1 Tax=uncultured Bacteroides sp. TaxID=162156 RepID=UPI0025DCCF8A|nr:hypothetical protein [uncultured Bacteroides sp.]